MRKPFRPKSTTDEISIFLGRQGGQGELECKIYYRRVGNSNWTIKQMKPSHSIDGNDYWVALMCGPFASGSHWEYVLRYNVGSRPWNYVYKSRQRNQSVRDFHVAKATPFRFTVR